MARLIGIRVAEMVVVLLVLTAVLFVLRQLQPVDPARVALGPQASIGAIEEYRRELGYDEPWIKQYFTYVRDITRGDFQTSVRTRRAVSDDLRATVPATIELAFYALLLAVAGGLILGVVAAARIPGSFAIRGVMTLGAAIPSFLAAFAGILFFSRHLGWLPGTGRTGITDAPTGPTRLLTVDALLAGRLDVFVDALRHLLLPASAIAVTSAVAIGRVLRSSLSSVLQTPYARTARAKGLTERSVIFRHGLRNAAGPAISMAGLQLGLMFAGVVIVETIFAWPGVGSYMAQSIPTNDFAAIGAVTLVLGAAYVVINTVVDILQLIADPRIRHDVR
jgi:peptide/nickel transport system permease protein